MPTVIAYHEIDNQEHWLASPNRQKFFGPLGVTGIREFVDPQNPARVAVLMEIPDMDAVTAALQTDEAARVMGEDGVRPETLVILVAAT
jgi:hypothetical protein